MVSKIIKCNDTNFLYIFTSLFPSCCVPRIKFLNYLVSFRISISREIKNLKYLSVPISKISSDTHFQGVIIFTSNFGLPCIRNQDPNDRLSWLAIIGWQKLLFWNFAGGVVKGVSSMDLLWLMG